MRFLKQKNISKWSVSDNTFIQNASGRITIDSNNSLLLPRGTTAQRPGYDAADPEAIDYTKLSGLVESGNLNGLIRYNTTLNQIEAYIDGIWETIRAAGSRTISRQQLGPGDDIEVMFGPLDQVPAQPSGTLGAPYDYPIIVLVENVFQISGENYDIVYDSTQAFIEFATPVPSGKYITIYYGFDN